MWEGSLLKIDLNISSNFKERLASSKCNQQKTFQRKPTFDCSIGSFLFLFLEIWCLCVFLCLHVRGHRHMEVWGGCHVSFSTALYLILWGGGLSFTWGGHGFPTTANQLVLGSPASASQVQKCEAGSMLTGHSHGCCTAEVCSSHLSDKCLPHHEAPPVLTSVAFKSAQLSSPKLLNSIQLWCIRHESIR